MTFFKIIGKDEAPTRLFVGGVHGKEGLTTIKALSRIENNCVKDGKLIINNFDESRYISTLKKEYYNSYTGEKLLSLIKKYKPEIYIELHCYKQDSYSKLTDENRKEKKGVPPLIELEKNVLIGSVSPLIRTTFFKMYDFSFVLEIPCNPSSESLDVYVDILEMIARSRNRFEVLDELRVPYPSQVAKAEEYFLEFSDNIAVIFNKAKAEARRLNLKDSASIKRILLKMASDMGINVTPMQAHQIAEAVMVFHRHQGNLKVRETKFKGFKKNQR